MKTKHLFLIFGGLALVLVIASWLAFPDWRATPGGLVTLIGVAGLAALAVVKDVVSILKDAREMNEKKPAAAQPGRSKQTATHSKHVEQGMQGSSGGDWEQRVDHSEHVKQSMRGAGGQRSQAVEDSSDVTQSQE